MAKCPRCKEDMPTLSRICPLCGYIDEQEVKQGSPKDTIIKLQENLLAIRNIPEPSFLNSFGSLAFIMYPLIAIFILVLAAISNGGLFWILFGLFAILSIVSIIRTANGKTKNAIFNKNFQSLKNEYGYNKKMAETYYGKDPEIAESLNNISKEIEQVETHRKKVKLQNIIIWLSIIIIIVVVLVKVVFSANDYINENMPAAEQIELLIKAGEIEKAYSVFIEKNGAEKQLQSLCNNLISAMLNAKNIKLAEDFFLTNCMGELKDFENASIIINYYNSIHDSGSATKFVDACKGMRYKSDTDKLRKLIAN